LGILAKEGYIVQKPGLGSFVTYTKPDNQTWGVVLPFYSIQYEDLVNRISIGAASKNREVVHRCAYHDWSREISIVDEMLRESYEIIIVIPTSDESKTRDFYQKISSLSSLIVMMDHSMSNYDFNSIITSYDLGVIRAMNYLLDITEGGIAFVGTSVWAEKNQILDIMKSTYEDYMEKRRPDYQPHFYERPNLIQAESVKERGITGLICFDDLSSIQAIGTLKEQGMEAGEDYNLISFGNSTLSKYFTPAISSIDLQNKKMVSELLEMVELREQNAPGKFKSIIEPEIIIRST
ncbi:MAG: LacI family transcriptional regulator, partial [Proteobacteria bacterium]|nr:LacI family transcriptional regulator [Pseudomonadota bacterium]